MWQMLLILLSIVLLVSTLIPSLRGEARPKKLAGEPEGLKIIYPSTTLADCFYAACRRAIFGSAGIAAVVG